MHAIDPQALLEFFGTLSAEWALDCLRELLVSNMAANLQLVVNIAKEYTEQLGSDKIIALLEAHNSYPGLYFYLGGRIAFSEDPEEHYKYSEAAARTGQVCLWWWCLCCARARPVFPAPKNSPTLPSHNQKPNNNKKNPTKKQNYKSCLRSSA